MKRRILSILTALCLALTLLPATALAEETGDSTSAEQNETQRDGILMRSETPVPNALEGTALPDAANGVITLDENVTLSEGWTIEASENITLDLNGYTLNMGSKKITVNGSLTVKDGTGTIGRLIGTNEVILVKQNATLKLESGAVEATGATAIKMEYRNGITFTMTGGTVKGTGNTVNAMKGSVTVTGGRIETSSTKISDYAIQNQYGDATITIGTSGGNKDDVYITSVRGHKDAVLTINSGTVGKIGVVVNTTDTINGYIEQDFSDILPAGKTCESYTEDGNTYYRIIDLTEENAQAKIGSTLYASAATAAKALKENETLTLLKDITVEAGRNGSYDGLLEIEARNVTIDLNGHSVTNTSNDGIGISVKNPIKSPCADGTVTIRNDGNPASITATIPVYFSSGNSLYKMVGKLEGNITLNTTDTGESAQQIGLGAGALLAYSIDAAKAIGNGGYKAEDTSGNAYIYGSLGNAVDADADGTVELLNNYVGTAHITLSDATGVLEMNGHTYTYTGIQQGDSAGGAIYMAKNKDSANLTVQNGTVIATNHDGVGIIYDNNSLTLKNVALTAVGDCGIITNGQDRNNNVTLIESTVTAANGVGIYFPSMDGKLTITDSDVTGKYSGIEIRASELEVTGDSEITATATSFSANPNGNGTTVSGAGIAVVQHTTKQPIKVTIGEGVKVSGYYAFYEENLQKNTDEDVAKITLSVTGGEFMATGADGKAVYSEDCKKFISGGTFSSGVAEYVTTNNASVGQTNGTFVVKPVSEVPENSIQDDVGNYYEDADAAQSGSAASITNASGTTYYASLEAAVEKATAGDTIILLKNMTVEDDAISIEKDVTVDLNGKTITGKDTRAFHVKSGTLTLTGTGTVTSVKPDGGSLESSQSVIRVGASEAAKDTKTGLVVERGVTIEAPATYGISVFGSAGVETVTIKGKVTATGPAAAVSGNGSYDGPTITLVGATISANCGVAIYHPQNGRMDITASTVDGGIEAKSGVITIENSTISAAEGKVPDHTVSGNGPSTSGYAIAIVDNAGYNDGAMLTIKSGTVDGDVVYLKDNDGVAAGSEEGRINITGGTFNGSVSAGGGAEKYNIDISGGSFPNASADDLEGMLGNNAVTVTFDANGGICAVNTMVVPGNQAIGTLPTATRSGYNFVGWYYNGALVTGDTTFNVTGISARSVTLTASWSLIPDDSEPTYSNTMDVSDGGTIKVSPRTPEAGETVTITPTPDRGYDVGTVTVTDRNGKEIKVTEHRNSTWTFTQPHGRVTIEVTFVPTGEVVGETPFLDVAENAWYADAVAYVYENGLMSGTASNLFSPDATTTRGMIVTMLYRLEGEPRVTSGSAFDDVDASMYYADAIAWANANGIVTGYDEATFGPNDAITREQMAAILYRYAQYKGYDTTQGGMAIREYADYESISEYALTAMDWAASAGLVTGTSNTTLTPDGSAIRAQVATIFQRFMEGVAE